MLLWLEGEKWGRFGCFRWYLFGGISRGLLRENPYENAVKSARKVFSAQAKFQKATNKNTLFTKKNN